MRVLAFSLILWLVVSMCPVWSQEIYPYIPGELIVRFTESAYPSVLGCSSGQGTVMSPDENINALFQSLSVSSLEPLHPYDVDTQIGIEMGLRRSYLLHIPVSADCNEAIALLRSNPAVEFASLNKVCSIQAIPNDPLFAQQWALPAINKKREHTNSSSTAHISEAVCIFAA